jgi:hypothetical protein
MIRRRHVFYVEGYDPQGADGYYNLFARSWKRFLNIWPLKSTLGALEIDSEEFAHWDIETAGPNWQVSTRYEFLRQEHIIRANMAEPLTRQIRRALGWAFDYLVSGALLRVLRASWEFGLVLIHFQLMLIWWLVLSAAGGWLVGYAAEYAGLAGPVAFLIGVAAAFATFALLRLLAKRWFVIQINSHWPYLCEFARGEASCFDRPIDACAERLIAVARANAVDEIVVVGHSGGGAIAPVVVARALELDPEVGRRGPPIMLLTLGSIMPGAALHPKAVKLRAVVARLAVEQSILWIDCQSRKDVMNFWEFDPVEGIGVEVGRARCNPLVWRLYFYHILSPEFYRRLRYNFFRMHYQFIMANDRRAPYDYFMLTCGPVPLATWAASAVMATYAADTNLAASELMTAYAEDATLAEDRVAERAAGEGISRATAAQ